MKPPVNVDKQVVKEVVVLMVNAFDQIEWKSNRSNTTITCRRKLKNESKFVPEKKLDIDVSIPFLI